MAKGKIRRALDVHFLDGSTKTLELSRATALDMDAPGMIHFDEMADKTWRLTYTSPLFDRALKDIDKIVIVRK